MSDLTTRDDQLPADFGDALMKGIDNTRADMRVGSGGGKPFFRLLKRGDFVWGQQDDPMQEGSRWAVNLKTLSRGWVCWGAGAMQGKLLGQVMASVRAPKLVEPPPVNGFAFKEQFGLEMTCIDGEDAGTEVLYKNHSYGFTKAFDALLDEVRTRYAIDKEFYWPIVVLTSESYDHKQHGEIFNPIFTVVDWANEDGESAIDRDHDRQLAKPKAVSKAGKPAKPSLRAVETPAEPAEPVSTQRAQRRAPAPAASAEALDRQASAILKNAGAESLTRAEPAPVHTGQRRRPAAR